MRNRISLLTLVILGVATISSVDVEAKGKRKTSRFKGSQAQVINKATNPTASNGLTPPTNASRSATAADCLAGTYFNGTACDVCAAGTYSAAGATDCTPCGPNVALCDGKTGIIISCATGYKLESGACVVDSNASTDPDKEKFAKLKEKYALQLAEVSASCSGISNELDTIFGLNTVTIASSGVGTAASGAAFATNLIKVNRQNKALEAAKSTADVEKLTDEDFKEVYETWKTSRDGIVVDDHSNKELLEVAGKIKDLANEAGVPLNDFEEKYNTLKKDLDDMEALNAQISSLGDDESDKKAELEKEKEKILDRVTGATVRTGEDLGSASTEGDAPAVKKAADELLGSLKDIDLTAYAKVQKDAKLAEISGGKSANGLGTATTLSMAGSALASATSTTTSAINIAKINKVLKNIEECKARLDDLRIIKGEMSTLQVDDVNKTVEQADKIDAACKFEESDLKAVKGFTIASTATSGVGTATSTIGAITSGLSNSKNEEKFTADKKKKLNTATRVLAGISAGTGASTTVTSSIASAKIKPVLEQAKKCTNALQENLVNVKYSRAISDISFDGE